jgi:cytochrome c
MKPFATLTLCATLLFAAPELPAADREAAETLARRSGCFTCHAVDRKLIGPSFRDIGQKYRGDSAAEAQLVQKTKAGSRGAWGDVPMPPNGHVKDADLHTLVQWILSLP